MEQGTFGDGHEQRQRVPSARRFSGARADRTAHRRGKWNAAIALAHPVRLRAQEPAGRGTLLGEKKIPAISVAGLIGAVSAALYVHAANPAVGGGNSGEFQVMAPLLGIAHPPSYPLYLLLAKAASLVPLRGDVAWRINVLTALCAGLAVFLTGALPVQLGRRAPAVTVTPAESGRWLASPETTLAGALAGIAAAAMPRLWSLAVEAEVFSLHLSLVVAFWIALARWQAADPQTADRWLMAASVLAGLGLANHRTFLFVATAGLGLVVLTDGRTLARPALVLSCLGLVGIGLSPYLYVLRGLRWPVPYFSPIDVHRLSRSEVWYVLEGNASAETGGGDVVRRLFADRTLLASRTAWLWGHLTAQFGPAGRLLALAGVAGLVVAWRRQPVWTASALLGAGGAAVFAMAYGKYPDADRYLLPLEVLLALGQGLLGASAAAAAQRRLEQLASLGRTAGRLLGLAAGLALGVYWSLCIGILSGITTFSRGGYVYHTLNNLDAVEPHAVVCSWWASAWGWWYAQVVDGHRPDVAVVAKGPDDCLRDVVPREFGERPVYLPATTDAVRNGDFVFFPSRDLWLAVARRAPLVDGVLLKGPNDKIYLYEHGQRRWVPSMEAFNSHGFRWERVQLTADYVLAQIPEGPPLDN